MRSKTNTGLRAKSGREGRGDTTSYHIFSSAWSRRICLPTARDVFGYWDAHLISPTVALFDVLDLDMSCRASGLSVWVSERLQDRVLSARVLPRAGAYN